MFIKLEIKSFPMPEVISKYPDIVIKVLQEAGARCGEGLPQQILKACPAERFCSLPTGEICVYGIDQISQMTQISGNEIAQVVSAAPQAALSWEVVFLIVIVFIAAFAFGVLFQKARKGK